ncbi:MAG: hypothetical protein MK082_10060 [Phycisphaerales bacterium]|nr:hypothetical protein [Phycisphaerales bacterium]
MTPSLAMNPMQSTMLVFACSALVAMLLLVVVAIRWFPLWLQMITLLFCTFILWVGLFLGSDIGYRNWQNMEDPPDEAFTDTAPMVYLVAGWFPAGVATFGCWGLLTLVVNTVRRGRAAKAPPFIDPGAPDAPPTNPPDSR